MQQQKIRARKRHEESEIGAIMERLERRKETELRLRLERERIKRELQSVDQSRLSTMGAEKRRELETLAQEKANLASRERDLALEVGRLETKIQSQEAEWKQQQEERLGVNDRHKATSRAEKKQQELLDLARRRGERAAALTTQRAQLSARRASEAKNPVLSSLIQYFVSLSRPRSVRS